VDFSEVDIVKQAVEIGQGYAFDQLRRSAFWVTQWELRGPDTPLESPAEAVFAVAFAFHQLYGREFALRRQVSIEANGQPYRFDFVVNAWRHEPLRLQQLPLAVEIDGHAFHEKTREQVERRNRRDRDVQVAGFTVMHFSYSELIRDPMGCAESVVQAAIVIDGARNENSQE
jgi:very-short-patch-repair endonuclease